MADLSLAKLEKLALNAMKSAFAPFDKRLKIIFETIKPGYAAAAASANIPFGKLPL